MKIKAILSLSFCFSGFLLLISANAVFAAFNPGRIISDEEFIDSGSMSVADVQNFLARRGGTLANRQIEDFNKVTKPVSEAIIEIGKLYNINPKVILVTLQKESSLLTHQAPSQRLLDYAMGYGCPDSGGCSTKAAGFYRQMDFATWQFRQYFDLPGNYSFKAGGTYTFTDLSGSKISTVIIENQATAGLYNYTPHVYNGNYNFYTLYNQWFAKIYPDGSLVRVGKSPGIWLIQNGERRAIQTRAAFVTRFGGDYSKVLPITQDALENYPRGVNIRLPNYSLVRTPDMQIYLLSGDEKRLIQSQEIFKNLGFNPEEVEDVSFEDLTDYLDGIQVSNASAYPAGALVQIKGSGVVWIEQGVWYPILDKSILKSRFPNRRPTLTITNEELNKYSKGQPLKLRDGELVQVKGEAGISVISNGLRRGIPSRELLKQFGYNKKNIILINSRVAELHPVGEKLNNANL
ncbi:MAG: hypothetical protein WCT08_01550 [Patescibacteria group bacterium]|jgi:hypothetical protein